MARALALGAGFNLTPSQSCPYLLCDDICCYLYMYLGFSLVLQAEVA